MTQELAPRPRLLICVTDGVSARILLRGQLRRLVEAGFQVAVAASPGEHLDEAGRREGVACFPVTMKRRPSAVADVLALVELAKVIRRWQPDIVSASTPKAGLLGTMAATFVGGCDRVYVLRGLRLETEGGIRRFLLFLAEVFVAKLACSVVCVSPSLRDLYVGMGLANGVDVRVLGAGSSNGVDLVRFRPPESAREKEEARRQLGLEPDRFVVGFIGRLTEDKGIYELLRAFIHTILPMSGGSAQLLLVGPDEQTPFGCARELRELLAHPRVVRTGFVDEPRTCYWAMDILAFPSKREGFPNAPLEAAACGLPTVGFAATGTRDAVIDGETGRLVPIGDVDALASAVVTYMIEPQGARTHGGNARSRAAKLFAAEHVHGRWVGFYRERAALGANA